QTFSPNDAEQQMALDIDDFLNAAHKRLGNRFGEITALSKRFSYPLAGVYARKFTRPSFALVGDAAIGMHPITAHGFNLGVQGQSILADHVRRAVSSNRSPNHPDGLAAYEREHRRLSKTFYWSTVAIAELYAHDSLPAKVARRALLDAGRFVPFARNMIMKELTQPLKSP
ncbi:MAG: FAD-dependent monooxygenase, partial [Pseudomonadota bacterium]